MLQTIRKRQLCFVHTVNFYEKVNVLRSTTIAESSNISVSSILSFRKKVVVVRECLEDSSLMNESMKSVCASGGAADVILPFVTIGSWTHSDRR